MASSVKDQVSGSFTYDENYSEQHSSMSAGTPQYNVFHSSPNKDILIAQECCTHSASNNVYSDPQRNQETSLTLRHMLCLIPL